MKLFSEIIAKLKYLASSDVNAMFIESKHILKPNDKFIDEIYVIESEFNTLKRNERIGVLDINTADIRRSQITKRLIDLVNELTESNINEKYNNKSFDKDQLIEASQDRISEFRDEIITMHGKYLNVCFDSMIIDWINLESQRACDKIFLISNMLSELNLFESKDLLGAVNITGSIKSNLNIVESYIEEDNEGFPKIEYYKDKFKNLNDLNSKVEICKEMFLLKKNGMELNSNLRKAIREIKKNDYNIFNRLEKEVQIQYAILNTREKIIKHISTIFD